MSMFSFQWMLNRLDNSTQKVQGEALELIQKSQSDYIFDQDRFFLYKAFKLTSQLRKSNQVLERSKGVSLRHECRRLMLLNQFRSVYKLLSVEGMNIPMRTIAYYYIIGFNEYSNLWFASSPSEQVRFLSQLYQLDSMNATMQDGRILFFSEAEKQFNQPSRKKNYKLCYVAKFRFQAYHFTQETNDCLNCNLIEMSFTQMCRIMILPTDYFDQYYDAFMHIIDKIVSPDQLTIDVCQTATYYEHYENFFNIINLSLPQFKVDDVNLFKNSVHTGITRAIVNKKIHLTFEFYDELLSEEQITGILDAILVLRRLSKYSQYDEIDDIIYDTIIYKLK